MSSWDRYHYHHHYNYHHHHNKPIPWSRIVLDKRTATQLLMNFAVFCAVSRFITLWPLIATVPSSKHTNPLHALPSRFVLMVSPDPCLDLFTYSVSFSFTYHLNIICSPVRSHACSTLRQSYTCCDNLTIVGEEYNLIIVGEEYKFQWSLSYSLVLSPVVTSH